MITALQNLRHPLYLHNLGNVYQEVGRLKEALNAFKRAIALKRNRHLCSVDDRLESRGCVQLPIDWDLSHETTHRLSTGGAVADTRHK